MGQTCSWGGYPNGGIPLKVMVYQNGGWLQPAAAYWFEAMADACEKATGHRISMLEGYRALGIPADRKVRVQSKTSTGGSNQWYQQGREDRGLTTAAIPGYSNHGCAIAADLLGYEAAGVWAWLLEHADEYHWSWATGRASGERWHWEYVGSLKIPAPKPVAVPVEADVDILSAPKAGAKPIFIKAKRPDGSTWYYLIDAAGKTTQSQSASYVTKWTKAYGAPKIGTQATVEAAKVTNAPVSVLFAAAVLYKPLPTPQTVTDYTGLLTKLNRKAYVPIAVTQHDLELAAGTMPVAA